MTKRSRNLAPSTSTSAPEYFSHQEEVLVIDMTYHTREDHSLRYDEIYRIFNTKIFLPMMKTLKYIRTSRREEFIW
jgi:hypothetical protein